MDDSDSSNPLGNGLFLLLAVAVGLVAGLGALAFRALIGLFHNLFFYGRPGLAYPIDEPMAASVWGPGVVLVPALGGLVVVYLVRRFAPEAQGNGVPDVIEANHFAQGHLPLRVALTRPLASAVSLGSGAPIGREGPVLQMGGALAYNVARFLELSVSQRTNMVAAGAAGAMAALFHTPVAAVLFAVELLLAEVGVRTVVPVVLAVVAAMFTAASLGAGTPEYLLPGLAEGIPYPTAAGFPVYVALGVLCGALALAFVEALNAAEDRFERLTRFHYLAHAAVMLGVGGMAYALLVTTGHYHLLGVGYPMLHALISGDLGAPGLLLLLAGLKFVATILSLGSGASGGVFAPAMFVGGTLAAALGLVLETVFPGFPANPSLMAIAGMAGLVGGATGAALTAITLLFELVGDPRILLPVMTTVALAYTVRRAWSRESVYTRKLARQGRIIPDSLHLNKHFYKTAGAVMNPRFTLIPEATPVTTLLAHPEWSREYDHWLVEREGRIVGWATWNGEALQHPEGLTARDLVRGGFARVSTRTRMLTALKTMDDAGASRLLVVSGEPVGPVPASAVHGVIGPEELLAEELADTRIFPRRAPDFL
jgi:CIC family chloride channel protein